MAKSKPCSAHKVVDRARWGRGGHPPHNTWWRRYVGRRPRDTRRWWRRRTHAWLATLQFEAELEEKLLGVLIPMCPELPLILIHFPGWDLLEEKILHS